MTVTEPETAVPAEITEYVDAVRARLVDLDGDEIDDLTDDLHSHLAEIRAESDEPFEEILGPPEQFADELRQSAGLLDAPASGMSLGSFHRAADAASARIKRLLAPLAAHGWARAVADFLPELRPAWWVARGYLLTLVLALMTGGRLATFLLIPSIAGSTIAGFLVMVGLIIASIRFGRRRIDAGWGRAVSVVTAVLAAWVAVILFDQLSSSYLVTSYSEPVPIAFDETFTQPGSPVNIYAVLPDGTPIDQVLLYDETGEPLDLVANGYSTKLDSEFEAQLAVDGTGRSVTSLYPRQLLIPDWMGHLEDPVSDQPDYEVVPPPTIEFGVPITPSDGRPQASTTTTSPTDEPGS